jgi:hypothetical protein
VRFQDDSVANVLALPDPTGMLAQLLLDGTYAESRCQDPAMQ